MLTRACSASVRRSSRCRSQRSTSTTWVCTVAARWPGRVPGRRRGDGRSSRSPPSTPVRTHPAWHDQTQRAPGEEEIDLWRDDLHPRARVLFVKPCGDRHRCQSGSQSRRENLDRTTMSTPLPDLLSLGDFAETYFPGGKTRTMDGFAVTCP